MLFITMESDYALRIILTLVEEDRRLDANHLSNRTKVSLRFSLKILRKLAVAGIVNSFKGVGGGYELARHPNKISMLDILLVTEGSCALNRCLVDAEECSRNATSYCKLRKALSNISSKMQQEFDEITMDQLV